MSTSILEITSNENAFRQCVVQYFCLDLHWTRTLIIILWLFCRSFQCTVYGYGYAWIRDPMSIQLQNHTAFGICFFVSAFVCRCVCVSVHTMRVHKTKQNKNDKYNSHEPYMTDIDDLPYRCVWQYTQNERIDWMERVKKKSKIHEQTTCVCICDIHARVHFFSFSLYLPLRLCALPLHSLFNVHV